MVATADQRSTGLKGRKAIQAGSLLMSGEEADLRRRAFTSPLRTRPLQMKGQPPKALPAFPVVDSAMLLSLCGLGRRLFAQTDCGRGHWSGRWGRKSACISK